LITPVRGLAASLYSGVSEEGASQVNVADNAVLGQLSQTSR